MPKKNMEKFIRYSFVFLLLIAGCKVSQPEDKVYPKQQFLVSLYSIGTGTDQEAEAIIINTTDKYKKQGYPIAYSTHHWGKEGETDYCFQLGHLEPKNYDKFFNELSDLLKGKQVHIRQNQSCNAN
jgi:hypothetical protein